MSQQMLTAAVTMNQLQHKIDNIGNNMANVGTNGYKTRNTEFASLLYRQIDNLSDPANAQGRLTPDGVRTGTGAQAASMKFDFANGTVTPTDRPLDTALVRENLYYQVQTTQDGEEQTLYTRDGAFYLSPYGEDSLLLTASDGSPVLGEDGPIVVEEGFNRIFINDDGAVVTEQDGENTVVGQLGIVEFVRPHLLEASGTNRFYLPDLEELDFAMDEIVQAPEGTEPVLQSRAIERSNVDIAQQMTDLVTAQRAYQMNARTLTMGDQMMGLVNQLRS
jgi:flagellar basal-body rod protein FlgG